MGEFNRASQHLDIEELRWEQAGVDGLSVLCVLRCVHLVVRRWDGASIGGGSGKGSPLGCRARMRAWRPVCLLRSEHAGSGRVAAWQQAPLPRCDGATCRSLSEKRSPSFMLATTVCARSSIGWADHRQRSRGSCVPTLQPVAATWSIGPRPPSGTQTDAPDVRRWPSSSRTMH